MEFFKYLESLSWGIGSLVTIGLFLTFAITGIFLVRQFIPTKNLKAHHDVAGYVFANMGVLYSVLLGFTVVNVQQRFDKVTATTHVEASILMELYRDSKVFSKKDGETIRHALKEYITMVVEDEWPQMSQGKNSTKADTAMNNIWNAYYNIDLTTSKQQAWYTESINKLNILTSARLDRLLGSIESLGPEMWTLLILGGLLMISFILFFGLESLTTHILLASILASVTAFLLFLIYSLDTSFSGEVTIEPEAFRRAIKAINPSELTLGFGMVIGVRTPTIKFNDLLS